MAERFIKLYNKMLSWEWYDDVNTCRVFIHCLLKANWQPTKWHGIQLKAGQFVTSLTTLAEETCLTVSQVRTALEHLQSTNEIANKSQSKYRIITVNSWDEYQGNDKQIANKSQSNRRVIATDTEDIEDTESINININNKKSGVFHPPSVEDVKAYCLERKNNVDPVSFINFYASKGWMVGKNKMKDWKACVRTWEQRHKDDPKKPGFKIENERKYDYDELIKELNE